MQPHNRNLQPLMDDLRKSYEVPALRNTGISQTTSCANGNMCDLSAMKCGVCMQTLLTTAAAVISRGSNVR